MGSLPESTAPGNIRNRQDESQQNRQDVLEIESLRNGDFFFFFV
jgi:hypothetical protein